MIETFIETYTASIVRTGLVLAGVVVGYLVAARYGRMMLRRLAERTGDGTARADSLWSMLRRILLVLATVVLVLMLMSTWGMSIAPLLAVGSAVGVALGFGAQDLVKDVIAGFFILAEDQFRIGQVVKVAGVAGVVEDIRPRVTVLRDLDGNVHYVPNGEIKVASNLTQEFAQVVVDVGVAYKTDLDRALEVLGDELSVFAADPDWAPMVIEAPSVLGVETLGDSAVTLRGVIKVGALDRWNVRRELLRRVKRRFDAEGIEIPFPHLTLYRGDAED